MAKIDLGRVMLVAQGAYSPTKAYQKLDTVSYNGSTYVCLQDNTGQAPTDVTYWSVLAMRGSVGPAGPAGENGATGPSGPKGDTGAQGPAGKDAVSQILDTQSTNQLPGWYHTNNPKKVVTEFKQTAAIGITQALMPSGQTLGTYCSLTTETPWSDSSGGSVFQTAKLINQTRPVVLIRVGTSDTAWSAWELMTTW